MGTIKKKKQKHVRQGFTLIELVVVITIFATVGVVIVSLLSISLRGTNKSETLTTVKQNGNFALSQIVKSIRYASNISSPASCVPSTTSSTLSVITYPEKHQITYSCPTSTDPAISSNSASLIDTNSVQVSACSFTCVQASVLEPPRVTIQFTLSSKNSNSFTETQSTIPFQASVIMRNAAQ